MTLKGPFVIFPKRPKGSGNVKKPREKKDKTQKKSKLRTIIFVTSTTLGVVALAAFMAKKLLPETFVYHVEGMPNCTVNATEGAAATYNRVEEQMKVAYDTSTKVDIDPKDKVIWDVVNDKITDYIEENEGGNSLGRFHRLVRS